MITLVPRRCKVDGIPKYRLVVKNHGTASLDNIVSVMTMQTTVTRTDALAVISALQRVIQRYLAMGYSVSVGELGIFQLRIKTRGAQTYDDFKAENILATHVTFVPTTDLKQTIKLGAPGVNLRVLTN